MHILPDRRAKLLNMPSGLVSRLILPGKGFDISTFDERHFVVGQALKFLLSSALGELSLPGMKEAEKQCFQSAWQVHVRADIRHELIM